MLSGIDRVTSLPAGCAFQKNALAAAAGSGNPNHIPTAGCAAEYRQAPPPLSASSMKIGLLCSSHPSWQLFVVTGRPPTRVQVSNATAMSIAMHQPCRSRLQTRFLVIPRDSWRFLLKSAGCRSCEAGPMTDRTPEQTGFHPPGPPSRPPSTVAARLVCVSGEHL